MSRQIAVMEAGEYSTGRERGPAMCQQTVHIRLWINPDSEPICGWVAADDGEREEFAGWVELTAAIETARIALARAAPRSAERR